MNPHELRPSPPFLAVWGGFHGLHPTSVLKDADRAAHLVGGRQAGPSFHGHGPLGKRIGELAIDPFPKLHGRIEVAIHRRQLSPTIAAAAGYSRGKPPRLAMSTIHGRNRRFSGSGLSRVARSVQISSAGRLSGRHVELFIPRADR